MLMNSMPEEEEEDRVILSRILPKYLLREKKYWRYHVSVVKKYDDTFRRFDKDQYCDGRERREDRVAITYV